LSPHLVDAVPLSDLCDKDQIQLAQFYQWQKQLFENADDAFERDRKLAEAGARRARQRQQEREKVTAA
jgi:hypothetical protein